MIGSLLLQIALRQKPEVVNAQPVAVNFSAFDTQGNYLYTRHAWIFLGPAEKADGYPAPPDVEVRDIITNIHLVTVPTGELCSVIPSATIQEYGGGGEFGCKP